jgi:phosphoglycolate phosphatase
VSQRPKRPGGAADERRAQLEPGRAPIAGMPTSISGTPASSSAWAIAGLRSSVKAAPAVRSPSRSVVSLTIGRGRAVQGSWRVPGRLGRLMASAVAAAPNAQAPASQVPFANPPAVRLVRIAPGPSAGAPFDRLGILAAMSPGPHDLLLFDLDGTLSDPLEGIARSINHALEAHGFAARPEPSLSACVGPPLDVSFRALTGRDDPALIATLVERYRERYGDVGYAENRLYDGVPEALAALSARGVPMAVCTSKRVDFAEQILALFGLRAHFGFVSGGEIGVPKWQQLQALCADGRVGPCSVMVGDRAVDLVAAHRNGLAGAGVLWGHAEPGELEAESPRYLIRRPDELLSLADRRAA